MEKSNISRQKEVVSSNLLPSGKNKNHINEKETSNTECETSKRLSRPAKIIHDAAGCVSEIKFVCSSNLQELHKAKENGDTSRKSRLLTRNMIRRLEERLKA